MFNLFNKNSFLEIFLCHSLFVDHSEISRSLMDASPDHAMTMQRFREFIENRLRGGYIFVSPGDLLRKEWELGKYALITFDDGYYNNHRALEVLEEYGVPALFFISTDNVIRRRSFWWDVLFREMKRRGISREKIIIERQKMKRLNYKQIDDYITESFGEGAFEPVNDVERPFTPDELRDFSGKRLVYLGNHTRHHAILTNYSPEEMREEILGAEDDFKKIGVGSTRILAYPNGNVSGEVIKAAGDGGIEIGMTVKEEKNKLPLYSKGAKSMILGRFVI